MVSASRTQLLVGVNGWNRRSLLRSDMDGTRVIISALVLLLKEGRVNVGFFLVRSWGCKLKL